MSARNLVRTLRDSGVLEAGSRPAGGRILPTILAGLFFGAVMYFAATAGVPAVLHALERPPAPISFARP